MIPVLEKIILHMWEILALLIILAQAVIFPVLLRSMVKKRTITLEETNRKLRNDKFVRGKLESELLHSLSFLKTVINSIGDPIYVKDNNSTFVLANEAYCRLVGRDPYEMSGTRLNDIYTNEEAKVILQRDGLILENGNEMTYEEQIVDGAGREHIFHSKKYLYTEGSEKSFIIGIKREITERRKIEEKLKTAYLELESRVSERTSELKNTNLALNREIAERKQMENLLTTRLRYERALSDSLKELLRGSQSPDPLEKVMGHLLEASGAMRVYYYECTEDDVYGPRLVKLGEALSHTPGGEIKGSELEDNLLKGALRRWSDMLSDKRPVMGTLDDFPPAEGDFLKSRGVSSILLLPARIDDRRMGLIGFDDSWKRIWREEELSLLNTAAKMISLYLERVKADEEIDCYQKRLLDLAADLSLAEEKERRRIASLLHDDIGQILAHIRIKLELMERLPVCPDNFSETVSQVTALLAESITRLRSLTSQLSPPLLYEVGFGAALRWLGERFHEEHGLCVEVRGDNIRKELDESISVTLFQVIRELMVNVVKHAKASNVRISVEKRNNKVRITFVDDGIGFNIREAEKKEGFGLFDLLQKIRHLGGEIRIESKAGYGTGVYLFAPLNGEDTATNRKSNRRCGRYDRFNLLGSIRKA